LKNISFILQFSICKLQFSIFKEKTMSRKTIVAGFVILAAFAAVAIARPAMASNIFWYGFEQDLKPWVPGLDSGVKDYSFERITGENGCNDLHGNAHANLKYVPTDARSAAWIAASFTSSGSDAVAISFNAKNGGTCADCKPVVYVGAVAPVQGAQFVDPLSPPPPPIDNVATARFAPLSAPSKGIIPGWRNYRFGMGVRGAKNIYVALGMSGTSTATKASPTASIAIDCVTVEIKIKTTH
jgi:hypothetical protein